MMLTFQFSRSIKNFLLMLENEAINKLEAPNGNKVKRDKKDRQQIDGRILKLALLPVQVLEN